MGDKRRPFDINPAIFIAITLVALFGVLIALNIRERSDSVETSATRALKDGSDVVVARQVGEQPAGRQIVSPQVASPQLSDSIALADGDDVEVVDAEVAGNFEEVEPEPGASDDDSDELVIAAPATTSAPTPTAAPLSATTTSSTTTTVGRETATTVRRATTTTTTRPRVTTTTRRTTTTTRPRVTTTTRRTTTTTTTTTTTAPQVSGRYTVAQIIDGTIGAGDGSNPNEEAPMGRHDASLYLPQSWNWAQGPTRNTLWGKLNSGQFAEFRCAVIPENGHNPPVPFRVNVREGAYFQFANGNWNRAFDVALDSPQNGGYLGQAGQLNSDPFSSGGHGRIDWRREADGSYSAPWNANALMMHFWAGERQSPASGQTAEFLTSEMRLQQPDGQTVDLSQVRVLFQCGLDYYNSTGGQGTRVPGPGIAKYHRLTSSWEPSLWVTLPGNVAANSTSDFRTWLEANLPPNVRP